MRGGRGEGEAWGGSRRVALVHTPHLLRAPDPLSAHTHTPMKGQAGCRSRLTRGGAVLGNVDVCSPLLRACATGRPPRQEEVEVWVWD